MGLLVFHLCRRAEWERFRSADAYQGSAAARADGFLHFSTARQLPGSLARYYGHELGMVAIAADSAVVGTALRWEASTGGELFPHVYADLPLGAVGSVLAILAGPDGANVLPALPHEDRHAIDPSRLDLAQEYKAQPYGVHSPELQAVLNVMRAPARAEGYILVMGGGRWRLAVSRAGMTAPEFVAQPAFASPEAAEWAVFKRRWLAITGVAVPFD